MRQQKLIYIAYGSNLNKHQMARRCPNAKPLGGFLLPDHKMIFRGVADIIPLKGHVCPVGFWEITDKCEYSLDVYEGFPTLYRKEFITIKFNETDEVHDCLVYKMNRGSFGMPSEVYARSIMRGYRDFNLSLDQFHQSVQYTSEQVELQVVPNKSYQLW